MRTKTANNGTKNNRKTRVRVWEGAGETQQKTAKTANNERKNNRRAHVRVWDGDGEMYSLAFLLLKHDLAVPS
jgi:hypothetical protein